MPDGLLNQFVAIGTAAERAAFTPDPPSVLAGPAQGYIWYETDTGKLIVFDGAALVEYDATANGAAPENGIETVTLLVSDPNGSPITTGDGKAYYRVPSTLNGMNLIAVAAQLTTASSSGTPTIQIANVTDAVDMLSTRITIDASEKDSSTAATPAVINTSNDGVTTGDQLRIDIDVAGTGAKGLIVEMQFQAP